MANEKRLIDANALKAHINGVSTHWLNDWSTLGVLVAVDKQPTVDAVEVVRCVNCVSHGNCLTEDTFRIARIDNPYCCGGKLKTNCGAKMDGGNEDG